MKNMKKPPHGCGGDLIHGLRGALDRNVVVPMILGLLLVSRPHVCPDSGWLPGLTAIRDDDPDGFIGADSRQTGHSHYSGVLVYLLGLSRKAPSVPGIAIL